MRTLMEGLSQLVNSLMSGKNRRVDIPYANSSAKKYDEYPVTDPKAPIVMFWHGGSWTNGDKKDYPFMGKYFQKMGFRAVVVGYPLYPEQKFPGFINDAEAALNKVREEYPDAPIFLCGHSAGAHTAIIAALRAKDIAGCIAISTPCNISKKHWGHVFGDAFRDNSQDPRTYVNNSPTSTRYILIHGKFDTTVSPKDSITLNQKLLNHGAKSRMILLATDHIAIFLNLIFSRKLKREIQYFILTK